jgi:hypothetical protein
MKKLKKVIPILILCLAMGVWLAGCAGKGAPEKTNCDTRIKWDVVELVKITQFDCAVGKHSGQTSLIFTVGLENPTDQPYRYRVNILRAAQRQTAGRKSRKSSNRQNPFYRYRQNAEKSLGDGDDDEQVTACTRIH